ncbi:dynamin family protein [Edaphobacillus lindanitolerans]|uniref:Dynamin family protein n=1 Tax=Edaphobacillus lindanitolerans TaxID=550447 RepID=A0A1U7PKX2_9BACI|nr:dynamin family protein [Edaphobacillus lindanitolerans]SIT66207.1 Dynamin family protein [Edaphobacillus lindanitolerans]
MAETKHVPIQEQATLIEEAGRLSVLFRRDGDKEREDRAERFARKVIRNEFVIGFAGHFSAGKSSMINALTGVDLLATGPIPTSANIVRIHKAEEDFAIIHRTDGPPVRFTGNLDLQYIKEFSKDGAGVSDIEVGHAGSALPDGVTVMDTPGVDSTDDAHRLSTESSLHIADLVFYVMDYNHVQSGLNFTFTKNLMQYNENVYLIVNQIDKHREQELSFEDFQESVRSSFASWGVHPKGIFYTSLKDPGLPHNDFNQVKALINDSIGNRDESLLKTGAGTLRKLADEHLEFLGDEVGERKATYAEIITEEEWNRRSEILQEAEEAARRVELLSPELWEDTFESARKHLLENAALMPFEVRDGMKEYLESRSSSFKVGFLFSSKKTEEERHAREERMLGQFRKTADAQATIHLRSLMKQSLREAGALTDEQALDIDRMDFEVPLSVIEGEVPQGALVTGDTVLNFTEAVRQAVIRWYIRKTDSWKKEQAIRIAEAANDSTDRLEQQAGSLSDKAGAIRAIEEAEEAMDQFRKALASKDTKLREEAVQTVAGWQEKEQAARRSVVDFDPSMAPEKPETAETGEKTDLSGRPAVSEAAADEAVRNAQLVSEQVHAIPGFAETAEYLRRKADRLGSKDFTIALFGAFSAGKSSFSNALIGEQVLPVSPNPTTAAINRIRPADTANGKASGTADIHLKTIEAMTEDVIRAFSEIGLTVRSLEEAHRLADQATAKEDIEDGKQLHRSFIRAFKAGYQVHGPLLGKTVNVAEAEFREYVADETRSCFVESIDFYYDCELTRRGITLVDTPGADSINARHTDVAFEYIRNADAILFVTYYNHAFAAADREFLIQLGRVKDAFEMDKMFFLVNAIDLAADGEEADLVKRYVAGELQRFGIRNPRLFGISSLLALEEKTAGKELGSGMDEFEKDFHHFLGEELNALAVQSLLEESRKAVSSLGELISRTEQNLSRKDERLEELRLYEQDLRKRYAQSGAPVIMNDVKAELDELVYYVLQRVFYRFTEFFREAYNPATFSSRPAKEALSVALREALGSVGFDIVQELKVTDLRLAKFTARKLTGRFTAEQRTLREMDPVFGLTPFEPDEKDSLSFPEVYPDPSVYSGVNRIFKNDKDFFEGGTRDKLRDALEEKAKKDAEQYLTIQKERMLKSFDQWTELEAEGLRQHLLQGALSKIASEREVLQETGNLAGWKEIYENLSRLEETT